MNDPVLIFLIVLIVLIIGSQLATGKADRRRISEQIESRGGQIIRVERPPLMSGRGGGRSARLYDVSYTTPKGERFNASCRVSGRVDWLSDIPPGFSSDENVTGMPTQNYVEEEPSGPAEPIRCLGCRTLMPENEVRCSQCGWSYKSN